MTLDFAYPLPALISGALAAIAIALAWHKRRHLGTPAIALLSLACLLAAAASGLPRLTTRSTSPVQVLLDMSASTRTADYRDPTHLAARLRELIPGARYHVTTFGVGQPSTVLSTISEPTLLFSDGQFAPASAGAPVFCIIDPNLNKASDARIERLIHERGRTIAITANSGPPRTLTANATTFIVPTGQYRIDIGSAFASAKASLNPGDDWPENDTMELPPEAPPGISNWCVGLTPPADFTQLTHADLPSDASAYLSTSLLMIDAGDAARLDPAQQSAIFTWVRELGGSLLVVGTDAAWSDLRRTPIESLSPLSVDPPEPRTEWVVLIDASGSMAQAEAGRTKWSSALGAAAAAIRSLPANDQVRLGSFAADVSWWRLTPAKDASPVAPAGLAPHGPTNLDLAIRQIQALPAASARHVLLLTDAEVELPSIAAIAEDLRSHNTSISCVALSDGRGISALRQLASATGGRVVSQSDPGAWPAAARALAAQLAPTRWHTTPLNIQLSPPFPQREIVAPGWNSAWPREKAQIVARGTQPSGEADVAATWQVGLGQVAAAAWPLSPGDLVEVAATFQRLPQDARYEITWPGEEPLLRVKGAANDVALHVTQDGQTTRISLTEVTPSLHELSWMPPLAGARTAVAADGRVIASKVFPARYAPEFDAIGTNRQDLEQLSARTGGQLIPTEDHSAIPLDLVPRRVPLAMWLGMGSLALSGAGVLLVRRRI